MIATKSRLSLKVMLLLVALVLMIVDHTFDLSGVKKMVSPTVSRLVSGMAQVQHQLFTIFQQRSHWFSLQQQLSRAQQENKTLQAELTQYEFLKQEHEQLLQQLQQTTTDLENEQLFSRVFGTQEALVIDKGESDGVKPQAFVFYNGMLFAKVSTVEANFSRLSLVGTDQFSLLAQTLNGTIGVVQREGGFLKITHIESDQSVQPNEAWYTVGDPERGIPRGLLFGTAVAIEQRTGQPTMKVVLENEPVPIGSLVVIKNQH